MNLPLQYKNFEYEALPSPTSIRLLRPVHIQKTPEAASINGVPLLQFVLEPSEHNDRPLYDALSYTWENPKPVRHGLPDEYVTQHKHVIAVNGRLLYITRNLYEALYRLQEPCRLSEDIDKRYQPWNKTRLIQAGEEGSLTLVMRCLEQGADHACQDKFGETALHYAAENGYPEIVKALLFAGAQPTTLDNSNRDPLACCIARKRRRWDETREILRNWVSQRGDNSHSEASTHGRGVSLWIDAICINQDDIAERNSQVAMMSQIYGSARCVVAWLGEEDDTTNAAFNCLSNIPQPVLQPTKVLARSYRNSYTRYCDHQRGKVLDINDRPHNIAMSVADVQSVINLFTRTWFSRTWVIQEATLAKDIYMICGSFHFEWSSIFALLFMLFGESASNDILSNGGPTAKFGKAGPGAQILTLFAIRSRNALMSRDATNARKSFLETDTVNPLCHQLSLLALFLLTWDFAVSDPRDKVFALLNVSGCSEGLTADYSKSIAEVFTEMAMILLRAEGYNKAYDLNGTMLDELEPLELLSFIQKPRAPRWKKSPMVPAFNVQLVSTRIYDDRYNAAGGRQAGISNPQAGILKVDISIVDTIAEVEEYPPEEGYRRIKNNDTIGLWLMIVSRLSPTYHSGESRIGAFWKTLASEHLKKSNRPDSAERYVQNMVLQWVAEHRRKDSIERHTDLCKIVEELLNADSSDLFLSISELINSNKGPMGKGWEMGTEERLFRWGLVRYMRGRCLMRTQLGYLAISSKDARPKDFVVIIAGGRTPFILRQSSNNQFTFIGEAYVHGIMYGEWLERQDCNFQPVEIR
ncbi:heterokaryon incompatibility 6 OR allele [Fusarium mexicanum]|uniref:Heterokaryon incompatibility 6 OR allele n=1 Tax=Fusarium mexicanum TaxID=751941 RepID=A0A8H5IQQ3_9HYPO|nr:heterokaryon incompatibility 6 OR allele [Fusarium mexicanum]